MEEKTIIAQTGHMSPKLIVLCRGQVTEHMLMGTRSFGRPSGTHTPDIPAASATVSRVHGLFESREGHCRYTDRNSTNGTLLNGKPLPPKTPVLLSDNDVLRVHGPEDENCSLDVVMVYTTSYHPDAVWRSQPLHEDIREITVGRSEPLSLAGPGVSRRHASFFNASGGWAVIDHGSLNGVFVDHCRITQPVYLAPMDVIVIGGYIFLFTGDQLLYQADPAANEQDHDEGPADCTMPLPNCPEEHDDKGVLSIWIQERNVWHRMKKKTLLRDIRLEIVAGSLVLVLGGSGVGKTTFMNAVMGFERAEGRMMWQDTDIYDEYEKMKYDIGYVPQQDLLRMSDTVSATLRNAACMRMPRGLAPEAYHEGVERAIRVLGLDTVRDTEVGKLSGGQRKRLSIAVEYIGDPSLFFLDEPDSGLDGTMARSLMENLRTIADDGRIVIVISHNPDRAFDLWDKVIVLAKDPRDDTGHLAFYGSPQEACAFFETDSLEKIVQRVNRPEEGGDGRADYYIEKYRNGGGKK